MTSGLITLNTTLILSVLSRLHLNTVFYSLSNALNNTLTKLLTLLMLERVRPFPLLDAADKR